MDLSFPIFEIVIQELEEEIHALESLQPILPLCYDAQDRVSSARKKGPYRYITFMLEKVDIVAF